MVRKTNPLARNRRMLLIIWCISGAEQITLKYCSAQCGAEQSAPYSEQFLSPWNLLDVPKAKPRSPYVTRYTTYMNRYNLLLCVEIFCLDEATWCKKFFRRDVRGASTLCKFSLSIRSVVCLAVSEVCQSDIFVVK